MASVARSDRVWLAVLLLVAGQVAQTDAQVFCQGDPDFPPALTLMGQSELLVPPAIDWEQRSFYPIRTADFAAGQRATRLDSIGNSSYSLETEFTYFGEAAEFNTEETTPPSYFLPLGWRDKDMVMFSWREPTGTQIVRIPTLRRGGVWVQDPAAGAGAEDTMLVSPKIDVYGSYTGSRDQKFTLRYGSKRAFMGDFVFSEMDPAAVAWDVSNHLIGDSLWYDTGSLHIGIGEQDTVICEMSWTENFIPDTEFAYAPGDRRRAGSIRVWTVYERTDSFTVVELANNYECAHPLGRGLYVSFSPGTYTRDVDYSVVAEVFEGYHVWRRVEGSSEGWVSIWEIEKNAERHKNYWYWIAGEFNLNTPPNYGYDPSTLTAIFGATDTRMFLDFDVHNGFRYHYAITSFDRGFRPSTPEGDNGHYILDSVEMANLEAAGRVHDFNRATGQSIVSRIYAVPNPLRTGRSAFEDPTYHNYPQNVVRFVGLTPGSELKVYSLSGDLIAEKGPEDLEGANMIWDTRNLAGEMVSSGVYVYRATNPEGEEEYGRLAVIR